MNQFVVVIDGTAYHWRPDSPVRILCHRHPNSVPATNFGIKHRQGDNRRSDAPREGVHLSYVQRSTKETP